ncbi:glycoside hydrolase [Acidaminobacter sp. JC074]|uniref:family 4 glycosyl hydrolase n=1 Tax=Acidaminobacter sp. JC074 TaxID=2530199 RepID=UPI001F106FFF|nr:6-phospho-beta-glucosidase [Acidaminobacter sp. JC074]MCH4888982.1 glycoside hydrolase [Acidaminobacter sp. JC074]
MKLTLIGGGGVRSPFLAKSIALGAHLGGIKEVVFMDTDKEKLDKFGLMAKIISNKINPDLDFKITTDSIEAIKDADYIITTLRVGQDEGRVIDERIAMKYNLLGQETTGAGGFGMALRSIDVLINYCQLIKEHAKKDALVFNFTNPSGIVTQALRKKGFNNVYGICDAPSEFIKQLVAILDVDENDFSIKCFGLNHLSWFKDARVKGKDVMGELLNHDKLYTDTEMRLFEPSLVKQSNNMLLNEYLYFYYYRDKAIKSIKSAGQTRGELIKEVNQDMMKELKTVDVQNNFDKAFNIFMSYYLIRENNYFSIESGELRPKQLQVPSVREMLDADDEGGYAGVALNFIKAYHSGKSVEMVLSIPNEGAINGLEDDDVVEISCTIKKGTIIPKHVGHVDDFQLNLIRTIKFYERNVVEAILEKSKSKAVKALTIHPLINSYDLAVKLVDEYLEAHKAYIGEWQE